MKEEKTFHPLPFWHLIGCVRVLAVLAPKLRRKDEAKCEGASIGIKSKVFWANFKSGRVKKKIWRERHWVKWWRSRKKTAELFDLCKKAVAMKQIKIASPAKDRKKTVGGEITNKSGQVSINKNFNAWTYYFSNIPEVSWLTCLSLFNRSFTSCWIVARGSL